MDKNKFRIKFLCIIGSASCDQLGVVIQQNTDDTVMMISVTESLIGNRGFNTKLLAKRQRYNLCDDGCNCLGIL
jgi:hypothetical protein